MKGMRVTRIYTGDDVDPIEFYISIASLGYFNLSNAHTLSTAFFRDLMRPAALRRRRLHMRDVILGYLRPMEPTERANREVAA